MKQKIPTGAVVVAIVIVIAGVAYFGWRVLSGGSQDMTKETINRYQKQREAMMARKPASPQEAARAGAPMGAGMMGATRGSTAPMGSAPMGATSGGAAGGSQ